MTNNGYQRRYLLGGYFPRHRPTVVNDDRYGIRTRRSIQLNTVSRIIGYMCHRKFYFGKLRKKIKNAYSFTRDAHWRD
jgi:hypothetical protein